MKIRYLALLTITIVTTLTESALGSVIVPEIDGSGAMIAFGLVVGMVALIRERRNRK